MKKNKNIIILVIGLLVFIMLVGGASYSYFIYNENVTVADLTSGNISINFTSSNNSLVLSNVLPTTDIMGRISNNYLDFAVTGTVDVEPIKYEIEIVLNGDSTLENRFVKVYLTDQDDNEIVSPRLVSNLIDSKANNGKILYNSTIETNDDGSLNNYSRSYRLRFWIDESYDSAEAKQYGFSIYLYAENAGNLFGNALLKKCGSVSYMKSYNDTVKNTNPTYATMDTYSGTGTKDVCYFTGDNAKANGNVLMGGFCWQIVRTTDTGGVKLLYNGLAENNQCKTDRIETKGINGIDGTQSNDMSQSMKYGDSFDYDLEAGTFTLKNAITETWSDSTYANLIGKWTCKSNDEICSTLYYVGHYQSNTSASLASYTIAPIAHYSQIGTSAYNAYNDSPALVGYMYNKVYAYQNGNKSGTYWSNVKWTGTEYALADDGTTSPSIDDTHHYICDTNCTKVRFYYWDNYYVLLEKGDINALKAMINYKENENEPDENINVYDSAIKGIIDNWYVKNLSNLESLLDKETVYCNDRNTTAINGWDRSTAMTANPAIFFKSYDGNNLNCVNMTDRFSGTNNSAKLTYPVGLLTEPERNLMQPLYVGTGQQWWLASPAIGNAGYYNRNVDINGNDDGKQTFVANAIRPVVTLRRDVELASGDGSYERPYIIEEPIDELYSYVTFKSTNENLKIVDDNNNLVDEYTKRILKSTATFSFIPEVTYSSGFIFEGWYTHPTGGTKITSTTPFIYDKSPTTLYAHILCATQDIEGSIVWDDEDNAHHTRPESIEITLYADGSPVNVTPTWTTTGLSRWTYTFSDMPIFSLNGNHITYTVRESIVDGYECLVSASTITCKLIPKEPKVFRDISGSITWNDNDNANNTRPNRVTVYLLRDGVEVAARNVTEATGWSYTFNDQPEDDGYDNTYVYEIRENGIGGYYSRIDDFNIIYTLLPNIDPDTPPRPGHEEDEPLP